MNNTDFILLIDDDEATRFYHSIMAEEANVTDRIIVAKNGLEGIEMMRKMAKNSPEQKGIIFIDINMPAVDGWEVLTEFEHINPAFINNQTIVMVSSIEHPKDLDKIKAHRLIKTFMPKPLIAEKIRLLAASI